MPVNGPIIMARNPRSRICASTLATIAGLIAPDAGTVSARGDMRMVFQDPYSSLDPRMRVVDSVREGGVAGLDAGEEGLDAEHEAAVAAAVDWWEELTAAGGEGVVVKPLPFVARDGKGRLAQPALKCRGREYLRIIYGPEYTLPEHLERLRTLGVLGTLAALERAGRVVGLYAGRSAS